MGKERRSQIQNLHGAVGMERWFVGADDQVQVALEDLVRYAG